jgi:hypothetical protein
MLRPRPSHGTRLFPVCLLAVTVLLTIESSSAGVSVDASRYRYAGVVAEGRGIPTHYVRRGEGFVFYFFDALSLGRKSTSYRLCVGPSGKRPIRCWDRKARYGVGKVAFSFTLPSDVRLGALTARWVVAGRTVANWPFLYVRGG